VNNGLGVGDAAGDPDVASDPDVTAGGALPQATTSDATATAPAVHRIRVTTNIIVDRTWQG